MKKYLILIALFILISQLSAQKIIYTSQVNNNDNLMILDEKGSIKALTDHPRKDSSPMISPDGKSMVFTSERVGWWKIWTLNLETNEFRQLTNRSSADYSPSWSPEGNKIVFTSTRDGNQEVYTMNKDGSNKINLTQSKSEDIMPFWSKNDYIYYSSNRDGFYQIMRMKSDGSEKELLTNTEGNKLMPQPAGDETKILYYGDADGNMEIYLMDLDTKKVMRLTNHPLMDMRPRWSPDYSQIVFERGNKGNNHHIYIMDADGSNVTKLTTKNYNYTPSFFPK